MSKAGFKDQFHGGMFQIDGLQLSRGTSAVMDLQMELERNEYIQQVQKSNQLYVVGFSHMKGRNGTPAETLNMEQNRINMDL